MVGKAYEKQADGSLLELRLVGRFQGYDDTTGDPLYGELRVSKLPEATLQPVVPYGAALGGSMPSRTSAALSWTPQAVATGRMPIVGWRVYVDGVAYGSDLAASTLSVSVTGLSTSTSPEAIHVFHVAALSAVGIGYNSNKVTLQWNGSQVSEPKPCQSLVAGTPTSSSVQLTWSEEVDATVTKHGIFLGDTLLRDNLASNATAYVLSSLSEATTYADVNVRRATSAGWSPASNMLTFTTQVSGPPAVVHDPLSGVNTEGPEPMYFTDWPATRVYRISDAISSFNLTGPRVIAVTDDPNVSRSSGAAGATAVRNMLINFYEGSGSAARQNCEIHWANGNEVDNEYQTGTLPQNVIDTWRLMYDAIHEESSPGVRRFPKASMWVDLTNYNVRTRGSGVRFKAIAPYVDGVAASLYNPGRQQDPIVWSAYDDYVLPVVQAAADWHETYPDRAYMFAAWEVGTPIDHATDAGGPNNLGTTNWSIRPRYFCGGRASGPTAPSTTQPMGSNYEGLYNNIYRRCDEYGLQCRELLYWNQQSNVSIPNPFKHDRIGVSTNPGPAPDLVTALHAWTPGSRLADL